MKWFDSWARGDAFPNARGDGVSGTVQSHGRSEGSRQHSGGFPGSAGGRLRRQVDACPERQFARRLPGAHVEGARGQGERAAAPRSRPAQVPVPLSLRRQDGDARSAGTRPDPAELSRAGRPRERRRDREHDDVLRNLGQRAVGALPARQRRAARRSPREVGVEGRLAMEREEYAHLPVLADEVTFLLRPRRGGWVVDGTIGMGGHAERLLEAGGEATRVLGIDSDPEALERARRRLARFGDRVRLRQGSFKDMSAHAEAAGVSQAASVLLDLGLSSYQLDASGRGFTFQKVEPLDMRFDPTRGRTAADLLAHATEADLARIVFEYGEERHARRIAKRIVHLRQRSPLTRTAHLVEAVKAGVPRAAWSRRTHVATRTFQAIRMAVNEEPEALRQALRAAPALLERGGRLGVISFHSGEDRAVKRAFRALATAGFVELVPSPVTASDPEVNGNPRARSAKLRVLERLEAA